MLLNGRHYSLDSRIDLESSASANPADHGRQKPRLHRCFHLNFSGQPTYFPNSAYCTTLFDNGTIRLLLTAFACFLHFVSHIFFFYVAIWLNLFYQIVLHTDKARFKRFHFFKTDLKKTILSNRFLILRNYSQFNWFLSGSLNRRLPVVQSMHTVFRNE